MNTEKLKDEIELEFFKIKSTNGKYEISHNGIVRNSLSRKELSKHFGAKGYIQVNLWLNNKEACRKLHRLIAEVFLPNPRNLPCINHKDGDKTNNNVENLEWCTIQENNSHYKNKTGVYNSKFKPGDVRDIFNRVKNGEAQIHLAKEYNVSKTTICQIVSRKIWSHLTLN